jgi:hypothetical protein
MRNKLRQHQERRARLPVGPMNMNISAKHMGFQT